ncbi:hypothetical protein ACS0TY_021019 [Phlomoides rotata]
MRFLQPTKTKVSGYDLLGRTQDQIKTTEQVNATLNACTTLKLDALIIIGGVTSNTDAAQLAETFAERNCPTKVYDITLCLMKHMLDLVLVSH